MSGNLTTSVTWLGVPELFSISLTTPIYTADGDATVTATVVAEALAEYSLSSTGGTVTGNDVSYDSVSADTVRTVVATNDHDAANFVSAMFTQIPIAVNTLCYGSDTLCFGSESLCFGS